MASGMGSEVIITENDMSAEVLEAIKQGRRVVAINMLRESTGLGMANAKVLVDRVASKVAPRPPRQTLMKDYKPTNTRLLGMVFVLAALFLGYRFLLTG